MKTNALNWTVCNRGINGREIILRTATYEAAKTHVLTAANNMTLYILPSRLCP